MSRTNSRVARCQAVNYCFLDGWNVTTAWYTKRKSLTMTLHFGKRIIIIDQVFLWSHVEDDPSACKRFGWDRTLDCTYYVGMKRSDHAQKSKLMPIWSLVEVWKKIYLTGFGYIFKKNSSAFREALETRLSDLAKGNQYSQASNPFGCYSCNCHNVGSGGHSCCCLLHCSLKN